MMNFTKHLIRIFPAIVLLLAQCSEPTPPGPITPPAADTTTHEYTWEYHLFGQSRVVSSWFRDINVESDDNFWMVGHVEVDTFVTSARGNRTQRVTAVHWDGQAFSAHAIDVMKISGSINTGPIYAIEGRNGSIYFMGAMSLTELRDRIYTVHDMRSLNGKWAGYERMDKFRSGRMFIYGGPGFAAELVQDKPLGPVSFRQIPLSTELPVATFAEAAEDDYYLGLWWQSSPEYFFWRVYRDQLIRLEFPPGDEGVRDLCAALWTDGTSIFAANPPYLFRQSIVDTSRRSFIILDQMLDTTMLPGMPNRMVGRADNDIFIVGDYGTIYHYNGKSIHVYMDLMRQLRHVRFLDVTVTERKVYIVGGGVVNGVARAILLIGTRR